MKKIIFLDLDGVLNISEGKNSTFKSRMEHFEPHLINMFNEFLDEFSINIVLSSSWRTDFEDALDQLANAGFKHIDLIISKTPFDPEKYLFRGEEIKAWINENNFNGKFICIDDDINQIIEFIEIEYCLKSDPSKGISKENIEYLKKYFI